jgi:hypothetical protein
VLVWMVIKEEYCKAIASSQTLSWVLMHLDTWRMPGNSLYPRSWAIRIELLGTLMLSLSGGVGDGSWGFMQWENSHRMISNSQDSIVTTLP